MSTAPVVVRVWGSDYGVPSVDPKSLMLLTTFKAHNVTVDVRTAYFPQWLSIPSISYGTRVTTSDSELITMANIVCKRANDLDLDVATQSRLLTYKKYFQESFVEIFYFECWLNPVNYEHSIKTWFNNVIPYPFNFFYLKKMRSLALQHFNNELFNSNPDQFKQQKLATASRCLEDFANMLSDGREYFFDTDLPTSLDIMVYSYLAIALKIPMPDPPVQILIKDHAELINFVDKLTNKYFPNTSNDLKYVEPVNTTSDRASTKCLVLMGIGVTTLMFLYAWNIGLIKPKLGTIRNKFF